MALTATGSLVVAVAMLAGGGPATADGPHPHPSLSTSPAPRPNIITGGVKMIPQALPGLAANTEAVHAPGEWYLADRASSRNPVADVNYVRHDDTGWYLVWFPGLRPAGAATVTVTGAATSRCEVTAVADSPVLHPGTDVTVFCGVDTTFLVRI